MEVFHISFFGGCQVLCVHVFSRHMQTIVILFIMLVISFMWPDASLINTVWKHTPDRRCPKDPVLKLNATQNTTDHNFKASDRTLRTTSPAMQTEGGRNPTPHMPERFPNSRTTSCKPALVTGTKELKPGPRKRTWVENYGASCWWWESWRQLFSLSRWLRK